MTGRTHATAGALTGALVGRLVGNPIPGLIVGALSALLPDIDHPGSEVGRRLRPVAVMLEAVAGHRTVTHTVWFCLASGFIFYLLVAFLAKFNPTITVVLHLKALTLIPWEAGLFGLLGSLSHLALDALTRSGVRPLEPVKDLHIAGPLVTGDPLTEWPACILFTVAALKLAGIV